MQAVKPASQQELIEWIETCEANAAFFKTLSMQQLLSPSSNKS